jgi:hypothetical protein
MAAAFEWHGIYWDWAGRIERAAVRSTNPFAEPDTCCQVLQSEWLGERVVGESGA